VQQFAQLVHVAFDAERHGERAALDELSNSVSWAFGKRESK
jgi:hypothetical protein